MHRGSLDVQFPPKRLICQTLARPQASYPAAEGVECLLRSIILSKVSLGHNIWLAGSGNVDCRHSRSCDARHFFGFYLAAAHTEETDYYAYVVNT